MTDTHQTNGNIQWQLEDIQSLEEDFSNILLKNPVPYDELDTLTRRFRELVLDIVGEKTIKAEPYKNWPSYPALGLITSDTPDSDFHDAYRRGAEQTKAEIQSIKLQLEKRKARLKPNDEPVQNELNIILRICERLPMSAKALVGRNRSKPDFDISDEYDVQDLLMAMTKAYFKYVIQEDPMSKIASSSSRADFSIEELGVLIEIKFVRSRSDQKRIEDEFAVDQQMYSKWPHLRHFIYVVYGAHLLKDHEILDKMGGDKNLNGREFKAYIVTC